MTGIIFKREFNNVMSGKVTRGVVLGLTAVLIIAGAVGGYFLRKNGVDTTIPVPENATVEGNPFGFLMGTISATLLLFAVIMGVQFINSGIVEEKQSRVVEIILTTVKPRKLLLAKILGIGSATLIAFAVVTSGIIIAAILAGVMPSVGQFSTLGLWTFLPTWILWLVLGYFTYAAISGAMASMASRQEDLSTASMILVFTSMIPFYVAMYLTPALPDSIWNKVLTFVPFFSPYVVPMRAGLGDITWLEQLGALATTCLTIYLLSVLAGKIYERSVLHMGSKLKFSEVLGKKATIG